MGGMWYIAPMTRHYLYSNTKTGNHLFVRIHPGKRTEHVTINDAPGQEDSCVDYHQMVRTMALEPKFAGYLRNWLNVPFKPKLGQKEVA